MPIAKGTAKQVGYKKETNWGVLAGAASGKLIRRATAAFNLTKETYESAEIRTDRQDADFRHGVRSATGSINGELSPGTYSDFTQSLLSRDYTVVTSITAASFTIAASGNLWTITRAAGSFITDGVNVGAVVRISAGAFNALNLNKNCLVVSMTATVLTVLVLNRSLMFAEGPIASATMTINGKRTFVPSSAHTDDSYTVEEWFPDVPQSEVYTGVKVGSMNVQLPATGLVTIDFSFQGKDLTQTGATQYFTSPTPLNTNGIFASVQGAVVVNGVPVALVTSADFTVEKALENATVAGTDSIAEVFTGRIKSMGNMSVYFDSPTFRDAFSNETVGSLVFALTTSTGATADFMTFTLPKVKFNSFDKDDGELGLTATVSFKALLNDVVTAGLPATTIQVVDSLA